jgi:hypothetical protein
MFSVSFLKLIAIFDQNPVSGFRIRIGIQPKMLVRDPKSMNPATKHWRKLGCFAESGVSNIT